MDSGCFYFIKDEFFIVYKDSNLMENKNPTHTKPRRTKNIIKFYQDYILNNISVLDKEVVLFKFWGSFNEKLSLFEIVHIRQLESNIDFRECPGKDCKSCQFKEDCRFALDDDIDY
jgi:hypothetical protein